MLLQRNSSNTTTPTVVLERPVVPLNPLSTIRIATWDLSPLDNEKVYDQTRIEKIVELLLPYDLIALQGIAVRNDAILIDLMKRLQLRGKNMTYAVSQGVGTVPEYLAFVFDQDRIKIDRSQLVDLVDPQGRLTIKPLAAMFRTTEPDGEKAFTFQLINVKLDPKRAGMERELLADIFRQFRDDPKGEDDIIMLGDFQLPLHEIGPLTELPDMVAVAQDRPTTVDGRWSLDQIFFNKRGTIEYVGRSGIVDFPTQFQLPPEEAGLIANHLPVWAEFSVFEGGQP